MRMLTFLSVLVLSFGSMAEIANANQSNQTLVRPPVTGSFHFPNIFDIFKPVQHHRYVHRIIHSTPASVQPNYADKPYCQAPDENGKCLDYYGGLPNYGFVPGDHNGIKKNPPPKAPDVLQNHIRPQYTLP